MRTFAWVDLEDVMGGDEAGKAAEKLAKEMHALLAWDHKCPWEEMRQDGKRGWLEAARYVAGQLRTGSEFDDDQLAEDAYRCFVSHADAEPATAPAFDILPKGSQDAWRAGVRRLRELLRAEEA